MGEARPLHRVVRRRRFVYPILAPLEESEHGVPFLAGRHPDRLLAVGLARVERRAAPRKHLEEAPAADHLVQLREVLAHRIWRAGLTRLALVRRGVVAVPSSELVGTWTTHGVHQRQTVFVPSQIWVSSWVAHSTT